MGDEATSKQLNNAHELFLLVPLKTGFVEKTERLTSYATRLEALLALLFGPTQSAVERTLMPTANTIDRLQNLYNFHYGVVDRASGAQLILGATFDSSWEMYFHNLVDIAGPFLDAIFCHCQGFEARSCADGYEAFAEFVREHQIAAGIFYSATPDLTADDLRLLRRAARGEPMDPLAPVGVEARAAYEKWRDEQVARREQPPFQKARDEGLSRFVASLWELRRLFPSSERLGARTAEDIFDEAVRQIRRSYDDPRDALRDVPREAEEWWTKLLPGPVVAPVAPAVPHLEEEQLDNIQGNILEPYVRVKHSALALVQLPADAAARSALLHALAAKVTTMKRAHEPVRLNVALTHRGLVRLGLDDAALQLFPKEFREGMAARAGVLGDVGWPNHPSEWDRLEINWPTPGTGDAPGTRATFAVDDVDLVLSVQAQAQYAEGDHLWTRQHPLHGEVETLLKALNLASAPAGGARVLRIEVLRRAAQDQFDNGTLARHESQPEPLATWGDRKEAPQPGVRYDNRVALGELLLGYPDQRQQVARCADAAKNREWSALFRDGTFSVLRKLRQDHGALELLVSESTPRDASPDTRRKAHGLVLGRCPATGRSLDVPVIPGTDKPEDPHNDFAYADDARGQRCPLYAHARRANPRDAANLPTPLDEGHGEVRAERRAPVPRVMRRGFSYGSDYVPGSRDQGDRGHFFVGYNASIAQQYEVIQRWINGGNVTGLLSTQPDLLAGTRAVPLGVRYAAPKEVCPTGSLHVPAAPLATLRWGMYLFVPSKRALTRLAEVSEGALRASRLERTRALRQGDRLLRELDAIASPTHARTAWQQLIEEYARHEDAADLWAAIRASGGTRETPYGLLVADLDNARRVLADDGRKFSVRTYWKRMRATIGEHYLGLDQQAAAQRVAHESEDDLAFEQRLHTAGHAERAGAANRVLRAHVTGPEAFDAAYAAAGARIAEMNGVLDLRQLAKLVVGDLAREWVGVPGGAKEPKALTDLVDAYIAVSRYCFFPYPEPWLERFALHVGPGLRRGHDDPALRASAFAQKLADAGYERAAIPSAMVGALVGFVAPAVSMLGAVLSTWLDDGTLTRIAPAIAGCEAQVARARLIGPLLATLRKRPVPPLVYRKALPGNGLTEPGNVVVVSLSSACIDAGERGEKEEGAWLFGGEHRATQDGSGTTHGCPMREPALQALCGVVARVATLLPLEKQSPVRYLRAR